MSLVHSGISAAPQHPTSRLRAAGRALGLAALCTLTLAAAYLVGAKDGAPHSPTQVAPLSLAHPAPTTRSSRYLDDLDKPPQVSWVAHARLQAAARRVCQQMQDGAGIGSLTPYSICVDKALREALGVSAGPDGRDIRRE